MNIKYPLHKLSVQSEVQIMAYLYFCIPVKILSFFMINFLPYYVN